MLVQSDNERDIEMCLCLVSLVIFDSCSPSECESGAGVAGDWLHDSTPCSTAGADNKHKEKFIILQYFTSPSYRPLPSS